MRAPDAGRKQALDCRPSDALNLAVLAGKPIYVSEECSPRATTTQEVARWREGKRN